MNLQDQGYKQWLADLKNKIRSTQIKAAVAINSMLIEFYWELGKMVAEKQTNWVVNFWRRFQRICEKNSPGCRDFRCQI